MEVHVCKLVIILNHMDGKVPEDAFIKLVQVTFRTLIEAFKSREVILLRHVIEFFLDVKKQNPHNEGIRKFDSYDVEVDKIIEVCISLL